MLSKLFHSLVILLLVLANSSICYKSIFHTLESEPEFNPDLPQIEAFDEPAGLAGRSIGNSDESLRETMDAMDGEDATDGDDAEEIGEPVDESSLAGRSMFGDSGEGSLLAGRAIHPIEDHCNVFDDQPLECRRNHCSYNCHVKECQSRKVQFCSQFGCDRHCGDPCGCKKAGCSYELTSNLCRKGHRACSIPFLEGLKCATKGSFYTKMGIICRNEHEDVNEDDDLDCNPTHIYGVNVNGVEVTDDKGRGYQEDASSLYSDPHRIRMPRSKSQSITGAHGDSQKLFQSWIIANDAKRQVGRCVSYNVPLEGDGLYEICIKMAEHKFRQAGKRAFNIRFNHQLIGHEIDIFDLAKDRNHAIELCFGYEVSGDETDLAVHGFPASTLTSKEHAGLAFCFSRCRDVEDGGFSVSAFRVTRWNLS